MKTRTIEIGEWLRHSTEKLADQSDQPALEAQLLLVEVLQKPRAWLLAHSEYLLDEHQFGDAELRLMQVLDGAQLPYVIGHWEFFGLDFVVNPAVLIPRPETELMVETALAWLRQHPQQRLAVDVGTGSGCIAASLAHHLPDLRVLALELNADAMRVAQVNFERLGVQERVRFVQSDLLDDLLEPVDVLCANLPYIPTADLKDLPVSRSEPRLALDGGEDGLRLVERLLRQMVEKRACRGLALLEIEARQGGRTKAMARRYFTDAEITVLRDLAGHDRLLSIAMRDKP